MICCHDDDDDVDARTLPFSPLSEGDSSLRDMTVAIHHYGADLSTPNPWQSTAASTISPLTSPREFRHRNGTFLESSRRQLFSEDDEVDAEVSAWIGSSWKFILRCLLIPLIAFSVYSHLKGSTTTVSLFSVRVWDTSRWESIPWSVLEFKVKDLFSNNVMDDANTVFSTSPHTPPIMDPSIPITDSPSSMVPPLGTTTFASLQQPRLILTPLPLALTMRPSFRRFLDHQFRQRGHWLLPLASSMVPGMGWVLVVAIISRLVLLGTPSPTATQ